MKKQFLLSICIILLTTSLVAQSVPNGGFESWHTVGGWYDNPDNWMTSNNQLLAPAVVRDSNAYQGQLAMRIVNVTSLPGWASTGLTLSQKPVLLQTYMKSDLALHDTVSIKVILYNNGLPMDSVIWTANTNSPTWTQLSISLPSTQPTADSINILVQGGKQLGSSMSLDEMTLETATGLNEPKQTSWKLYPSPMSNYAILTPGQGEFQDATFTLYNPLGQVMQQVSGIQGSTLRIERGDLPSGTYLFQVREQGKPIISGKLMIK